MLLINFLLVFLFDIIDTRITGPAVLLAAF